MPTFLNDLDTTQAGGGSVRPQASAAATVDGSAVDLLGAEGPVHLLASVGATTGTPTSFTVTWKLQESDTSGGTYADLGDAQTEVLSAVNTDAVISTGWRTKRFVRAVATVDFVGGTSPTVGISGVVVARKKITGTGNGAQTS